MYRTTIEFHNRISRGERPTVYILINTASGWRCIGQKAIDKIFDVDTTYLADGTYTADGSIRAGSDSYGLIDVQARLLGLSGMERTISPKTTNVLTALTTKQLQHLTAKINNADRYYTKILTTEPILGREMSAYVGYEAIPFSEHRCLFSGTISEIVIGNGGEMSLKADEQ